MDLTSTTLWMIPALLLGAALYASVGHGGASAYIAIMALFGLLPAEIRPSALTLNIVVSGIAAWQFISQGHINWKILLPLAASAVPLAFIGGMIHLPANLYRPLLGIVLLYAAGTLWWSAKAANEDAPKRALGIPLMAVLGAGIGFLSGLTGVGGGIFLSPLLLALGAAATRETSGISAVFIFVNSIAGLSGFLLKGGTIPSAVPVWAVAVAIGGFIGARWGARHFRTPTLRRLLSVVLAIAGLKMLGVG